MEKDASLPKKFTSAIFLFVFIIIIIWMSLLQFTMPDVGHKNRRVDLFSADRAMNYVKNIANKPHPLGSEEHERVKEYIVRTLTDLGVTPEIQSEEGVFSAWGGPYKGKIENIVGKIPGKDSSRAIMISAHYDSEGDSPGASDDGSGVAAILETIRALKNEKPLKNDIIIFISDGEEKGLLGAQLFVQKHPWAKEVGLVFNFEARGNGGPSVLFETNQGNERLISEYVKAVPNPLAHSFLYNLYKNTPHDTDLTVFKNAGMYGLNFGFFEGVNSYHTSQDTVENLSIESLQQQGDNMLHLAKHFGNMNLVAKKDGNKIFFNIIGHKVITYSDTLVLPLMILTVIVFGLTYIHGYKMGSLTLLKTCVSFFIFLGIAATSYILGEVMMDTIKIVAPNRIWLLETNLSVSNPLFLLIIIIQITLITIVYSFLLKKINWSNLMMGAFIGWLLLSVISSIWLKGSSYIFVLPLLFGLFGLNLYMRKKVHHSSLVRGILLILLVPILLITVPVIYLVYVILTLKALPILLLLVSIVYSYLIPVISYLKFRYLPVIPGLSIATIVCLFLLGRP